MKSALIQEMQAELLRLTGKGWFRILSGSMRPLIEVNDRILVKRINRKGIRKRDIVVFKSDDVFVAHRVIGFAGGGNRPLVLQKGDASVHAELISSDDVLGRVALVEKSGRLVDLSRGRGKILNGFLGIKSCLQYRYGASNPLSRGKIIRAAGSFVQNLLLKICL